MKKLYLFTNTQGNGHSGWEICYAMAEDGHVLGEHLCSTVNFMYQDLVNSRDCRNKLETFFGGKEDEAFEVIILPPGKICPPEVFEKNQKLREETVALHSAESKKKES